MNERDMRALRDAVVKQLGDPDQEELASTFSDVRNHGADTGWHGFTYNAETEKFYRANAENIHELLADYMEETGEDLPSSLVERMKEGFTGFSNWMAWFALEQIAQQEASDDDDEDEDDDDEEDEDDD